MGCWQGLLEVGWHAMNCWQGLLEVGWYHGLLAGTVRGGMVPWAAGRNC